MLIREEIEKRERDILSPYAAFADASLGRASAEEECDIRTCYQRDRDRILHCKSFRRLKDKTQVFLSPQGDHYRTRLLHTLEVSQIARTISKALMLNEDLTEAIALGHDLGHTPFGHAGERALNAVCPYGFRHNEQSVRVVSVLEKNGEGLNLTAEVLDGILNHQTAGCPKTLEGQVVRFSDKIAYIHHDMDDGIRARILTEEMIPEHLRQLLGNSTKQRLDTMVHDIIENSRGRNAVMMSGAIGEGMKELRQLMFDKLYTNPEAKHEEGRAIKMLTQLYGHYLDHPEDLGLEYRAMLDQGEDPARVVCDYISGMTDSFATKRFTLFFIPKSWEME